MRIVKSRTLTEPKYHRKDQFSRYTGTTKSEKAGTLDALKKLQLQLLTAQTEITPEAIGTSLSVRRAQFDRLEESGNVRELKAGCCNLFPELN